MAKFKLLAGKHVEGGKRYVPGNVIDSKSDLSKFNTPGYAPKFEEVPDSTPASPGQALHTPNAIKEGEKKEPVVAPPKYKLDGMSVKQLQDVADAEEVDVKGLKTPVEMIAKLKKELGYS